MKILIYINALLFSLFINKIKNKGNNRLFLLTVITFFIFLLSTGITAQEKVNYLQHRYDGYTEIIHKKTTKKQLQSIKNKFARQGVIFRFSGLKLNKKNEIIEINIDINNKKSKYSIKWNNDNKPIPKIKVGEINGLVIITNLMIK